MLRKYVLAATIAANGLAAGFAASAPAEAMLIVTVHSQAVPLIEVRNGCGRGWHLDGWGRCAPDRRYYHRHHYGWYRPHYHHGWHRPRHGYWRHHDHHHWRHHHHSSHHWGRK